MPPLRWVGQRSYGIYLWHWPIFMVLHPGTDLAARGWPVEAARFGLTVLAAQLSYRYVELPVRRGAVGRLWAGWRQAVRAGRPTRVPRVAAAAVGLVVALGVGLRAVHEPTLPAELEGLTPVGTGVLTASDAASASARMPGRTTPTPPTTAPTTAVGDSVMLAAAPALDAPLARVTVDADVSRGPEVIFDRIRERRGLGRLGDVVVIGAGTNGRIRDAGRRFAGGDVRVVDWDAYAASHPRSSTATAPPRPGAGAGAGAYARLVRAAAER